MKMQQPVVQIADDKLELTFGALEGILKSLPGDDNEMGIVCVTGKRDENKCILLNYITRYLMWLSRSQDGQDWQPSKDEETLFAQEKDVYKTGGFIWRQPFLVDIESKTPLPAQKLPLLLLDVSHDADFHMTAHLVKAKISSVDDFQRKISELIEIQDEQSLWMSLSLRVSQSFCLTRDWETPVSHFRSKELYSFPTKKKKEKTQSFSQRKQQFLTSIVYHMFGGICNSEDHILAEQLVYRDIFFESDDEPVVGNIVNLKIKQLRELLSDPVRNKESLVSMHNRMSKEAIDLIRNINCPSQVALNRIRIMNKRWNDAFSELKQKYMLWQDVRKKYHIMAHHMDYANSMIAGLGDPESVDDVDVQRLHKSVSAQCMHAYRMLMPVGETDLGEWIGPTFNLLQRMTAEAREKAYLSLNNTFDGHLNCFTDQMRKSIADTQRIVPQDIERKYTNIQAQRLRAFQSEINAQTMSAAVKRKLMKDLETRMDQVKKAVVSERAEFLKEMRRSMNETVSRYTARMQKEMAPYAGQEEAAVIHGKVMSEILCRWDNDAFLSELQNMIEKQSVVLWDKLQIQNKERETRVQKVADWHVKRYEHGMGEAVVNLKKKSATVGQLLREHNKLYNECLWSYKNDKNVKFAGANLLRVENELRKRIADSFETIREKYEKHTEERIWELMQNALHSYQVAMEKYFVTSHPKSIDELTKAHNKIRNQQLQHFRSTDLIHLHKEAHYEDHLEAQIQLEFEIIKTEMEIAIAKQEEVDLAVENAIGYYRSCMNEHLKVMKQCEDSEPVTRTVIHEKHVRFLDYALDFFRSNFKDDPECERVTKGEKELQEKISSALVSFYDEYVTDKRNVVTRTIGMVGSAAGKVISAPIKMVYNASGRLVEFVNRSPKKFSPETHPLPVLQPLSPPAKSYADVTASPKPSASKENVESKAESSASEELVAQELKDQGITLYELRVMDFVDHNPNVSDREIELKQLRIGKEILQEMRADRAPNNVVESTGFGIRRKWPEMWNQIQKNKQKPAWKL